MSQNNAKRKFGNSVAQGKDVASRPTKMSRDFEDNDDVDTFEADLATLDVDMVHHDGPVLGEGPENEQTSAIKRFN